MQKTCENDFGGTVLDLLEVANSDHRDRHLLHRIRLKNMQDWSSSAPHKQDDRMVLRQRMHQQGRRLDTVLLRMIRKAQTQRRVQI